MPERACGGAARGSPQWKVRYATQCRACGNVCRAAPRVVRPRRPSAPPPPPPRPAPNWSSTFQPCPAQQVKCHACGNGRWGGQVYTAAWKAQVGSRYVHVTRSRCLYKDCIPTMSPPSLVWGRWGGFTMAASCVHVQRAAYVKWKRHACA